MRRLSPVTLGSAPTLRSTLPVVLFAALVPMILASSCHHSFQALSKIDMREANANSQLLFGFYGADIGDWRWTGKDFGVTLAPPPGSDRNGADLHLRIYIPDSRIQELGPLTLEANAANCALRPETFDSAGSYDYTRVIPASELRTNLLPIYFRVDKAIGPTLTDARPLGVVAASVELNTHRRQ